MTAIPLPPHDIREKIFDAWKAREASARSDPRVHLGASEIGKPCLRAAWYTFRWADAEEFDGRLLRLFRTGELEEDRLADDLMMIGCEVVQLDVRTGKQFRVWHPWGHFGGSLDAAIHHVPDGGDKWHVGEFKTHNAKSFAKLQKLGVKAAKWEHFCQMVIYMGFTGMDRALYGAKNKDNDDLYFERVRFDETLFADLCRKAMSVIRSPEPLGRVSEDPESDECRYCPFRAVCHFGKPIKKSCRTCRHATPEEGTTWRCGFHQRGIAVPEQAVGCSEWWEIK